MSVPQIHVCEEYKRMKKIMSNVIDDFPSEEATIKDTVDALLTTLFVPTKNGYQVDKNRVEEGGFAHESINWGDIGCSDVERMEGGTYIVTVEEADPGCAEFAGWIGDWLRTWGWDVLVNTEW